MNEIEFPVLPTKTAQIRPIYWEPMPGSGERITVAIEVIQDGNRTLAPVLQDTVLKCLYGKSGRHLIEHLKTIITLMEDSLGVAPASIHYGRAMTLHVSTVEEALAAGIQRFASLSSMDLVEEVVSEDVPDQAEQIKTWSDQVKSWVLNQHPDLASYFGRRARIFDNGEPIQFGFLSNHACAHFGMIRPGRLAASVKDARARLYELHQAKSVAGIPNVGLILAVPRLDDMVSTTPRQHRAIQKNLNELRLESSHDGVAILTATNREEGGRALLELHGTPG